MSQIYKCIKYFISLHSESRVRISINDINGRNRFIKDLGTAGPGLFTQNVDLSSASLTKGTYIVNVHLETETLSGKLIR